MSEKLSHFDEATVDDFLYPLRREQTAAELEASESQAIEVGLCSSNSQLNTGECPSELEEKFRVDQ